MSNTKFGLEPYRGVGWYGGGFRVPADHHPRSFKEVERVYESITPVNFKSVGRQPADIRPLTVNRRYNERRIAKLSRDCYALLSGGEDGIMAPYILSGYPSEDRKRQYAAWINSDDGKKSQRNCASVVWLNARSVGCERILIRRPYGIATGSWAQFVVDVLPPGLDLMASRNHGEKAIAITAGDQNGKMVHLPNYKPDHITPSHRWDMHTVEKPLPYIAFERTKGFNSWRVSEGDVLGADDVSQWSSQHLVNHAYKKELGSALTRFVKEARVFQSLWDLDTIEDAVRKENGDDRAALVEYFDVEIDRTDHGVTQPYGNIYPRYDHGISPAGRTGQAHRKRMRAVTAEILRDDHPLRIPVMRLLLRDAYNNVGWRIRSIKYHGAANQQHLENAYEQLNTTFRRNVNKFFGVYLYKGDPKQ